MIKKLFALLFLSLFLCLFNGCANEPISSTQNVVSNPPEIVPSESRATYEAEIRFLDIPWESTPNEAYEILDDNLFLMGESQGIVKWEDADTLSATGYIQEPYGHFLISSYSGKDVAGYQTQNISLFFMYGVKDGAVNRGDESLYLARYFFSVVDIDGAYQDLREKLTTLYGEGEETVEKHPYTAAGVSDGKSFVDQYTIVKSCTIWHGQNNTAVKLIAKVDESGSENSWANVGLWLCYGKTDSTEKIDDLCKAIEQEIAEGEQMKRDSSNTNGL